MFAMLTVCRPTEWVVHLIYSNVFSMISGVYFSLYVFVFKYRRDGNPQLLWQIQNSCVLRGLRQLAAFRGSTSI